MRKQEDTVLNIKVTEQKWSLWANYDETLGEEPCNAHFLCLWRDSRDLCSISARIDKGNRPGRGVSVNSSLEAAQLPLKYSEIINSKMDLAFSLKSKISFCYLALPLYSLLRGNPNR